MDPELFNAFCKIKALLPSFPSATKHETNLLRSLLNRLESQVMGDDRDFDFWGMSAGEYAAMMLKECELPVPSEA